MWAASNFFEHFYSCFSPFLTSYVPPAEMVITNITDEWLDECRRMRDECRRVKTSEDELETSAGEWDTNENASPFARRFQMLESLHIAEHAYWFNV